MKMLAIQADRAARPEDLVASGATINMRFRTGKRALSLRAGKLFHLLVKAAGSNLTAATSHKFPLAEFQDIVHLSQAQIADIVAELQTTLVEIKGTIKASEADNDSVEWYSQRPNEQIPLVQRTISAPLLEYVDRRENDKGTVVFRFSRVLRSVFENATQWAIIQRRAVMAFESRYGLRLFELMSLRANLASKTSETFDLDDLRAHLGVVTGTLDTWDNFKRRALDPAIAEVNAIADFTVTSEQVKRGRAVTGVKLSWKSKAGKQAAQLEPPAGFPVSGSIGYSKWAGIVAAKCPVPTPDMDIVASAFRQWSASKGMRLDGSNVEATFSGFCTRFSR